MAKDKATKHMEASKCFGVLFDDEVKECRICELSYRCKQQQLANEFYKNDAEKRKAQGKPPRLDYSDIDIEKITMGEEVICGGDLADYFDSVPENVVDFKALKEKKEKTKSKKKTQEPKKKPAKPSKSYSKDLPDYKKMSIEEIKKHISSKGVDLGEFDKYTDSRILRMRLVVKLKSLYEK